MNARRSRTTPRLAPFTIPCLLLVVLAANGCVPRSTARNLEQRVSRLEKDNLRLRKELAEAQVRLEMEKETRLQAAPAAGTEVASKPEEAPSPQAAPMESADPLVIYSEPITDPSGYTGGAGTGPSGSGSTEALFASAIEMLDGGRAEEAMAVFGSIVRERPDDPLADDAQFGIGEALFRMGRYQEAIAAYRGVANDFPFGDTVPSAFLKMGFAHLALEQRESAMDSFVTVSDAYPGTEAATVARQQIAHLKASATR